jgi:hypothetical protein
MIYTLRNKKISFYQALFGFLIIILAFGFLRLVLLQGKWATHKDTEKGFSIEYPANWHISSYTAGHRNWPELYIELDPRGLLTTNDVWVLGEEMEQPTLLDAIAWSEKLIDRQHGNYVSEPEWTAMGLHAYPAIKRTFTRLGRFHITAFYLTTDSSMIALEFTTNFNQSDPEIKQTYAHMLGTFQLLDE